MTHIVKRCALSVKIKTDNLAGSLFSMARVVDYPVPEKITEYLAKAVNARKLHVKLQRLWTNGDVLCITESRN